MEQNLTFVRIYNRTWAGMRWGSTYWRFVFGGRISAPLPTTAATQYRRVKSDDRSVEVVLKLYPANAKGVRKHRVFVGCKKCGKDVAAGRLMQHRC